jgi:phage shock protein A
MALITRLTRLFRADMHAVLDQIEEPQQLLRQAIREMEEALAAERQQHKTLHHEQAQLHRRHKELTEQLARGEEAIAIAFQSGEEVLARNLIRRRLERERLARMLVQQQESLGEQLRQLAQRLAHNQSELEGMRQKAELLSDDEPQGIVGSGYGELTVTVCDDEVEAAFLQERQRRMPS